MPLNPGDCAEPQNTWLRMITNPNYLKNDGTIHHSAFRGKAISPPDANKAWALELSGALLSLVPDLLTYGQMQCGDRFLGFMFQGVENLRNQELATDVVFTPTSDEAHADLVAYHLQEANKRKMEDWLQDFVQLASLNNLQIIDARRFSA